ncbi:MAG: hypothetical protein ACRD22_13880 [Terriglobia bacterium]
MNRKRILAGVSSIALAGALFFYLHGGGQTPTGQPPLQRLTSQNVNDIANAFNADKHDARVLLLLSPT